MFLANNVYFKNVAILKYLHETDYQKFVTLKKNKHLELSDYDHIWKVIILLLLANSVKKEELDHLAFSKSSKIKSLMEAIDSYYMNAFSPEIISVLNLIENSKEAAELITKYLKISGEQSKPQIFRNRNSRSIFYTYKNNLKWPFLN